MQNVQAAFNRIADRDERLGLRRGVLSSSVYAGRNPHLQGIQRVPNTNVMYVSGSDGRAQLLTGQLASRSSRGRFRSNRITSNAPPSSDRITGSRVLSSSLTHAGGFQVSGGLLAIGLEQSGRSETQLWEVSNPTRPRGPVMRIQRPNDQAGAVALVRDGNSWLMIVGRHNSDILDFYRGTPQLAFTLFATWHESELTGMDREFGNYQNLNLIRQRDGAPAPAQPSGTTRTSPSRDSEASATRSRRSVGSSRPAAPTGSTSTTATAVGRSRSRGPVGSERSLTSAPAASATPFRPRDTPSRTRRAARHRARGAHEPSAHRAPRPPPGTRT